MAFITNKYLWITTTTIAEKNTLTIKNL